MRGHKTSKRASVIVEDKSVMVALGLQCSCSVQCSDVANKRELWQAHHNYALLTKLEQLQKVYSVLLGAQNTITQVTLTAAGKLHFSQLQIKSFRLSTVPGGLHGVPRNFDLPVLYCSQACR
jgi:hypothetical protein